MAENSKIQWTTHTFNPWRGCTKVSAGCANCYAETLSGRNPKTLGVWGPNGTRVVASEAMWKEPLKWEKAAQTAFVAATMGGKLKPERPRVFCASLADVFEDWLCQLKVSNGQWATINRHFGKFTGYNGCNLSGGNDALMMQDVRARLFRLIDDTPNLDWLLLTKRPENIAKMMPAVGFPDAGVPGTLGRQLVFPNVWLGTSVDDKKAKSRIDILRKIPAAVRFLSIEPLLEDLGPLDLTGISWVILGGESGHGARPFRPEWARSIRDQCKTANIAFFFKQFGGNIVTRNDMIEDAFNDGHEGWPDPEVEHNINGFLEEYQGADCRIRLSDKKGGAIEEWPNDLRIREFPTVAS